MPRHLTIITGASRGLGLAVTAALLARGQRVLAMSRRPVALAVPPGAELLHWPVDLADAAPTAAISTVDLFSDMVSSNLLKGGKHRHPDIVHSCGAAGNVRE